MLSTLFLLQYLLFTAIPVDSNHETILLHDAANKIDISDYLYYFEDTSNRLQSNDITQQQIQSKFKKVHKKINHGFTRSTFWIRYHVKDVSSSPTTWYLLLDYPLIENVTLYKKNGDLLKKIAEISQQHQFNTTDILYTGRIFALNPDKKQIGEYYIKLKTRTTMRFPLSICNIHYINKTFSFKMHINGLYLGIILIMFLFNLFYYFIIRSYNSIFYSLYIIGFGLFVSIQNGIFFEIIPHFPIKYLLPLYMGAGSLVFIFSTLFTMFFLKTSIQLPKIHIILQGVIAISLVFLALLPFLDMSFMIQFFALFGILWSFANFLAGMYSLSTGYRSARFFITGWIFFFIGVVIFALRGFGLLPSNAITLYSVELGSILVIFFLSIAIADQYYIIQQEHSRQQSIIIEKEKTLRETQELLIQNLHQMSTFKDDLINATSRQLRTPLSSIIGITESLLGGIAGELNQKIIYNLQLVLASSKRLSRLIHNFLDYSQLKYNTTQLSLAAVDLKSMTDVVIDIIQKLPQSHSIAIKNNIPENLPLALADKDRLPQALFNIVYNIIKLTSDATITFHAAIQSDDPSKITIAINEDGKGLLPYIFDTILQQDIYHYQKTPKNSFLTGIELTIAKQLIELHGTTLSIDTNPTTGTTLSFSLQCADLSTKKDSHAYYKNNYIEYDHFIDLASMPHIENIDTTPIPSNQQSACIVLADSDPVLLKSIENNLVLNGYQVVKAYNGQEVLGILNSGILPDAMLLDSMLPRTNTLEVIRNIRTTYSIAELPIIVLSPIEEPESLMASFEAGANDYIVKPFYMYDVISRLKTQLLLKQAVQSIKRVSQIEKELDMARQIQQTLIPQETPVSDKYEIAHVYIPMDKVGGDYFNFNIKDDNHIGIFISDVSGHGMPAALIASMLQSLMHTVHHAANDPVSLLHILNTSLKKNLHNNFLTAMYLYIDFESMSCKVSRAGHEPLILYRRSQDEIYEILPEGRLMGLNLEPNYTLSEFSITTGDRIILFTDGIIESIDAQSNILGKKQFKHIIKKYREKPATECIDAIIDELKHFAYPNESFNNDDITVIIIDIK
ncbi:MAG: SpoIIE family protein phosphatase [Spirochaetota bacterium]